VETSGEVIPPAQIVEHFKACIIRGVTVGRHEASYQQSRRDVMAFVTKAVKRGP
jgi:hypothetical protein